MLPSHLCIAFYSGIIFVLLTGAPALMLCIGVALCAVCLLPGIRTKWLTRIAWWFTIGSIALSARLMFLEYQSQQLEQQIVQLGSRFTGIITQIQKTDHEKFSYMYDVCPGEKTFMNCILGCPLVRIYSRKKYECAIGDSIQIVSPIKIKKKTAFDTYKKRIGITATLFEPKVLIPNDLFIGAPARQGSPHTSVGHNQGSPHTSVGYECGVYKEAVLERITKKMSAATAVFFSTLFLGKTSHQSTFTDMRNICNYWGISHMLARSGLHLVIFIALFSFLFAYIPLYFRYKHCVIIGLLLLYTYLSWSSISFVRALMCMLLYHACAFLHIKISLLQALFVTATLIIFLNPYQSLFADFQLSFILTAALAGYSFLIKQANH